MGWDCYCAICGALFLTYVNVGTLMPINQEWRREQIAKERRRLRAQQEFESEKEEDESDDIWNEVYGYDPELVSAQSLQWLGIMHCIGFNPHALGISKAFISGPGEYKDYGIISTWRWGGWHHARTLDPNHPEQDDFQCYRKRDTDKTPVFPFHWCCFEILARALTGSPDVGKIDKDALYNVMAEVSLDNYLYCGQSLDLDYGNISREDSRWEPIPGQEFSVTHPLELPGFNEFLSTKIASENFKIPSASLNLGNRVVHDPFSKLPYDILCTLFPYLGESALALIRASWYVHGSTRDNMFWKQLIRREILPWFWELRELLAQEQSPDFGYKGLYLWLDKITTPEFVEGPFLGIANRRRIWGVCQQLADIHFKRLHQEPISETNEYAKAILEHSRSVQMPMVLYPQAEEGVNTVLKQWIRSWNEIDSRTAIFETFWSERALVGLSVMFGADRRVFGRSDTGVVGGKKIWRQVARIAADDWITGLVLHIPENLLDEGAHTAVEGVTLLFKSGRKNELGNIGRLCSQRPLVVSPDRFIVGIIGQIASDGLISRLGLLECTRPPNDDFSLYDADPAYARQSDHQEIPFSRRVLWHSSATFVFSVPISRGHYDILGPIWSQPCIRMLPLPPPAYSQYEVPSELVPYQALLWATNVMELRKLTRISSYVCVGSTASGALGGAQQTWPIHHILALRCEFVTGYGHAKREVPRIPSSWNVAGAGDWGKENALHFEIDGPGGEIVTELEISRADKPKAIRLRTNRGRVAYFGKLNCHHWDVQRPAEGEYIAGLAVSFRTKCRFSCGMGYSHPKLASVTALTRVMK